MARTSAAELARRRSVRRAIEDMRYQASRAFMDGAVLDNAGLLVLTKGQMRGLRAVLLRTLKPCR